MSQFLSQRLVLLPGVQLHWMQFQVISGRITCVAVLLTQIQGDKKYNSPASSQQLETCKIFASSNSFLPCLWAVFSLHSTWEIWNFPKDRRNEAWVNVCRLESEQCPNRDVRSHTHGKADWAADEGLWLQVWTRFRIIILISIFS